MDDYPLSYWLTADNISYLMRLFPETQTAFGAFQAGVMSWVSTLTLVIEILANKAEAAQLLLEQVQDCRYRPNMN